MSELTRDAIMEFLIKYHTATVAELREAFHFTKENIRHHLKVLQNEGVIELIQIPTENKKHPGRPSLVYHINIANQPSNIGKLTTALFHVYLENLPTCLEKQAGLKKLAQILFPSTFNKQNPTQLFNKSIQRLNQHSYQARWEAHNEGPLFIFINCPYAAVQSDQPELCLLDTYILENLLGSPVSQITKINYAGKNPSACVFRLNPPLA